MTTDSQTDHPDQKAGNYAEVFSDFERHLEKGQGVDGSETVIQALSKSSPTPEHKLRIDGIVGTLLQKGEYLAARKILLATDAFWPAKGIALVQIAVDCAKKADETWKQDFMALIGWVQNRGDTLSEAEKGVASAAVLEGLQQLVEDNRISDAEFLVQQLDAYFPDLPLGFRVARVRQGLRMLKADDAANALVLCRALVSEWPRWPAAQKFCRTMCERLFADNAAQIAWDLLQSISGNFTDKTFLQLEAALILTKSDRPGWQGYVDQALAGLSAVLAEMSDSEHKKCVSLGANCLQGLFAADRPSDGWYLQARLESAIAQFPLSVPFVVARGHLRSGDALAAFAVLVPGLDRLPLKDQPGHDTVQPLLLALFTALSKQEAFEAATRLLSCLNDEQLPDADTRLRVFLGCVPDDQQDWPPQLREALCALFNVLPTAEVVVPIESEKLRTAKQKASLATVVARDEALLEQGLVSASWRLAALMGRFVADYDQIHRKLAIQRVTSALDTNDLARSLPVMAQLLRDAPQWSAAQRTSVRLAKALAVGGDPKAGFALLNETNEIWPEKATFALECSLWRADRELSDWRPQLFSILRQLKIIASLATPAVLQSGDPEMARPEAMPVNPAALSQSEIAAQEQLRKDICTAALAMIKTAIREIVADNRIATAAWIARIARHLDSRLPIFSYAMGVTEARTWLEEGRVTDAIAMARFLVRQNDISASSYKFIEDMAKVMIDAGDLEGAEALIRSRGKMWKEGHKLMIASAGMRIEQKDPNWKWIFHCLWRDLHADPALSPSWIRTNVQQQFLHSGRLLLLLERLDDQVYDAICRYIPDFRLSYRKVILSIANQACAQGDIARAERLAWLLQRLHPDWVESHVIAMRLLLRSMKKDRSGAHRALVAFWGRIGHPLPLPNDDLSKALRAELLLECEGLIAADNLVHTRFLHDSFNHDIPDFPGRFRVQNVKIASGLFKAGQVKQAAGLLHMVLGLHPDWEACQRQAYVVGCKLLGRREFEIADELLAPGCDLWPEKHVVKLEYMIGKLVWLKPDWAVTLADWWSAFEKSGGLQDAQFYLPVRNLMIKLAGLMIEDGAHDKAESLLLNLRRRVSGDSAAHMLLARISEHRTDYQRATERWQMASALAKPSNNEQGRYMLKHGKAGRNLLSESNFGLRSARCLLALQLLERGEDRPFIEVVSRITESLGSTSVYQEDRLVLEVLSRYVNFCLSETHPAPKTIAVPGKLKRIVMCLDVLKLSDFHLHSRVVFTMSRSLLDRYPDLEIHVVSTNERFAVTRPNIGSWIDFDGNDFTFDYASKTVGEHFGTRFHLHFQRSYGLEGVVRSCKEIIDMKPDVIAYAGGHGRYSNDSRIVRHTLFGYVPSALFFLGVDNSIDDQVDMIIPRGPHELVGEPGNATIRVQTYPTLPDGEERVKVPEEKPEQRFIVSALAGERLDTRMRDMPEQELRLLLDILDQNPDVIWAFVGAHDTKGLVADVPLLRQYVSRGRVQVLPVMEINAFREFVTDATLFIQMPGFKGGAGGAGMARRGGVPVLTFANSDVSGRQPPETVFVEGDVSGMAQMASRLLGDPEEAARVTQSQFVYAEHIRETSVHGFYDCLYDTVKLAKARIEGTPLPAETDETA